jgi:glycerophosphoryl diester phosphodiesterase
VHQLHRSGRHLRAFPLRYLVALVAAYAVITLGGGALLSAMVDVAQQRAGITGLTDATVVRLLHTPGALALVCLGAALASAATLAFATMMFAAADLQLSGAAPSLRTLVRRTLTALRTLLRPATALLALVLTVIAPFAGFGLFSPLTAGLALPPFIERELVKTTGGIVCWTLLIGVLLYLTFRVILALPLVVVAGTRPARGLRTSVTATGRSGIPLALLLAASYGALWVVCRGATELLGQLVDVASPLLPNADVAVTLASLVLTLLSLAGTVFFALLLVGHTREVAGVASRPGPPIASPRSNASAAPQRRRFMARHPGLTAATAIALLAITGGNVIHTSAAYAGAHGDAIVIGHRGFDAGGVENTLGSLEAAVALQPDFVEVDVQQTKDGGFVTTHDSNLLILAGVNENIFDITTAEATSTIVRMKGNSGTIPTMAEFVTRAKQLGMPLLIEFKTHGHESPGFVAAALAELDSLGALSGNTYQSTNPAVVAEIERLHPGLRVGFTIGMLRGDAPEVDCDFYTLEQASYSTEFLAEAHTRGREVYVWTVNDDVTMRSLLRDGVDGLVTDRIDRAQHHRARVSVGTTYSPGDARDELLAGVAWD